jgi:ABC-type lipoprotein export system ATPase subunit
VIVVVLDVRNITVIYQAAHGQVHALDNLSLSVAAGEFVAVQGPSGCGKTTLLLAAGGLLEPTSGQVLLADQDLYALAVEPRARLRAAGIGFVFQQFHLVPYLSVLDNVLAPTLATPIPDARDRAAALLERFGLTSRARHVPAKLSTGERQRTALARALLTQPKLILADEPTGNLDAASADAVLEALAEFAGQGGAVLLVTHDIRAAGHARRTVQLRQGKLVMASALESVS